MKFSYTLEQTAKKFSPLIVFSPFSVYLGVYSFRLDLYLFSFCLGVPASDSCETEVFYLPSTSSQVLNSLLPNTVILKGLSATWISEGPYERNIKDHQRWQLDTNYGMRDLWDLRIRYSPWLLGYSFQVISRTVLTMESIPLTRICHQGLWPVSLILKKLYWCRHSHCLNNSL